jgi:hypothetical protein
VIRYLPSPRCAGHAPHRGLLLEAFDGTGKQIAYQGANRLLPLKPGDYQIKVNNSIHPVSVQSKTLAKWASGTVLLGTGKTDEYYPVSVSHCRERGLGLFDQGQRL